MMKNEPGSARITNVKLLAVSMPHRPELHRRLEVKFASPEAVVAVIDLADYLQEQPAEIDLRALLEMEVIKTAAVADGGMAIRWNCGADKTLEISAENLWAFSEQQHEMRRFAISAAKPLDGLKVRVTFSSPKSEILEIDLAPLFSDQESGGYYAPIRNPKIFQTVRPGMFNAMLQFGGELREGEFPHVDGEPLLIAAETLFALHEAQQNQALIQNAEVKTGRHLRMLFSQPEQDDITVNFVPFIGCFREFAPLGNPEVFKTAKTRNGGRAVGWNSIGNLEVSADILLKLARAQQYAIDEPMLALFAASTLEPAVVLSGLVRAWEWAPPGARVEAAEVARLFVAAYQNEPIEGINASDGWPEQDSAAP